MLVSPRNPLNIGAAARAMSNFGFSDLHLVNPYDVAFREANSAVRSRYVLEHAKVHGELSAALEGCSLVAGTTSLGHRDLHTTLHRLERGGRLIRQHWSKSGEQVALLFGSEKFGLSNDDLSHCHWCLRIPTRAEHESMNLGQAVAICLYELRREAREATKTYPASELAPSDDVERLTAQLKELLEKSGYVNERTRTSTELKLRRLLKRLQMNKHDAQIWLGMLRQIRWKLEQK